MKLIPILAAAIVAIGLYEATLNRAAIGAWLQNATAPQTPTSPAPKDRAPAPVTTYVPQTTTVSSSVEVAGRTEAARQVVVRAEATGKVVSEPLRRGAFVRQGQLLCQLSPGPLESRLNEARARVTAARAEVAEAEVLLAATETSPQDGDIHRGLVVAAMDSARANLAVAEATLNARRAEIEQLALTAPFDGLLETDSAELGSLLQPGDACATVIQMDPIKAVAQIAEADVGRIDIGTLATITLIDGATLAGRVTFLSRAANPETHAFRVEVELPNTDLTLRDGQSIQMSIASDPLLAHRIPLSAVDVEGNQMQVAIVTPDNKIDFVPVTEVDEDATWMVVLGLPKSPTLVLEAPNTTRRGETVTPRPIDPKSLEK